MRYILRIIAMIALLLMTIMQVRTSSALLELATLQMHNTLLKRQEAAVKLPTSLNEKEKFEIQGYAGTYAAFDDEEIMYRYVSDDKVTGKWGEKTWEFELKVGEYAEVYTCWGNLYAEVLRLDSGAEPIKIKLATWY